MKINFKEDNLDELSFKDLKYGLVLLGAELEAIDKDMKVLKKYKIETYKIKEIERETRMSLKLRIALIEEELTNRMLTGDDDGMLERELLGR